MMDCYAEKIFCEVVAGDMERHLVLGDCMSLV